MWVAADVAWVRASENADFGIEYFILYTFWKMFGLEGRRHTISPWSAERKSEREDTNAAVQALEQLADLMNYKTEIVFVIHNKFEESRSRKTQITSKHSTFTN